MNITEIRSKINGIIAAKDALDASFQKHMEASAYREYKERYDIREAIAFNLAYVITADADIARQELSNFDAICKLLGHGIKTAEYLAMLKVKAGSQFRSLKEKYSHDFSGDDVKTNMWAMMMSVSYLWDKYGFLVRVRYSMQHKKTPRQLRSEACRGVP